MFGLHQRDALFHPRARAEIDAYYETLKRLNRRADLAFRLRMMANITWGRDCRLLDRAADGELWRFTSDQEGYGVVQQSVLVVTCPSKGSDHVLFVPPRFTTARAARAWTFGLGEQEFDLAVET